MNYKVNRVYVGELTRIAKGVLNTLVPPAEQQGYYSPMTGSPVPKDGKASGMEQKERDTLPADQSANSQINSTVDLGGGGMSNTFGSRASSDRSGIDLQEAIIWSEILGKPLSKRRKRRYYGD